MAALVDAPEDVIKQLSFQIQDGASTLPSKYRALFSLRNVKGEQAHEALSRGLQDPSALLRHEVAFCMGQRQDPLAVQQLISILRDAQEHPMVRHEAGEALGAIATEECLEPLREHQQDTMREVAETCQLALQRIEYFASRPELGDTSSPYYSVDPTPPLPADTPLGELRALLLDDCGRMFDRYRALFALRNLGTPDAVAAICEAFGSGSALLKHEVAYVLGQLQSPASVDALVHVLQDAAEAPMVRHEAAEALGSIGRPECLRLLGEYSRDPEPIVADSCLVALDMLEFEASGGFDYCTGAQHAAVAGAS